MCDRPTKFGVTRKLNSYCYGRSRTGLEQINHAIAFRKMQLALTYIIEILVFAFVLLMAFDFVVGFIILWQRAAPPTQELPHDPNNIYNFGRILALVDE